MLWVNRFAVYIFFFFFFFFFLLFFCSFQNQLILVVEIQGLMRTWKAENLALESRVREEVTKEFSELFTQMQTDYK